MTKIVPNNIDGNYLITWTDSTTNALMLEKIDINGQSLGGATKINALYSASGASLIQLSGGDVLVAWNSNIGRMVNQEGVPISDEFTLKTDEVAPSLLSGGFVALRTAGFVGWQLYQYGIGSHAYSISFMDSLLAKYTAPDQNPKESVQDLADPITSVDSSDDGSTVLEGGHSGLGLLSHSGSFYSGLDSLEIAPTQIIGDFNGDGQDDLLLSDEKYSYLFLESKFISNHVNIASEANVIIDHAVFGVPAQRMGDVNNDGLADLLFVQGNKVNAIFGNRTTDPKPAQASWTKTFTEFSSAKNLEVSAVNWDGLPDYEIAVLSWREYTGNIQGFIGSIATGDWVNKLTINKDENSDRTLLINSLVPGDINGDGLEDLVIADSYQTYGIYGGMQGAIALNNASFRWFDSDPNLDDGTMRDIFALGDINSDGMDDFAIEFIHSKDGSIDDYYNLNIIFGEKDMPSEDFGVLSGSYSAADIIIKNSPVLPNLEPYLSQYESESSWIDSYWIEDIGQSSVTAGDYDRDGKMDIAIGRPFQKLKLHIEYSWQDPESSDVHHENVSEEIDSDTIGSVFIFNSIVEKWNSQPLKNGKTIPLTLNNADHHIQGDVSDGYFGILPVQPNLDIDQDGWDDLLVATPFADVYGDSIFYKAGTIGVYNFAEPTDLPTDAILLANSTTGEYLTDPFILANQTLNNGEQWYKFTTRGDGAKGGDNIIKIDQIDGYTLFANLYDADGNIVVVNQPLIIDLAGVRAGTYWFKVYDPDNVSTSDFSLIITPPTEGSALPLSDNDLLIGGDGNDLLVGGGYIDQMDGGAGTDVLIGEAIEWINQDASDRVISDFRSADDILKELMGLINPQIKLVTVIDDNNPYPYAIQDPELFKALKQAAGLSASQTLRLSDLTTLTYLDLRSINITSLKGLKLAKNLANLDVSNNQISDLSPLSGLTNLVVLNVSNNQISDLSPVSGLPQLNEFYHSGNPIITPKAVFSAENQTVTELSYQPLFEAFEVVSNAKPLESAPSLTTVGQDPYIPKITFIDTLVPMIASDVPLINHGDWLSAWVDGEQQKTKPKHKPGWKITLPEIESQ